MTCVISSLSLNPAIELPEAVALALMFLGAGIWLAWRGAGEAGESARMKMVILRALGLTMLSLLWLNPGHWNTQGGQVQRDWLVLLDRSASMKAEQSAESTRWEAGVLAAETLRKASGKDGRVHTHTFTTQLEDETRTLSALVPDGAGTDLGRAISGALEQRGVPLAGIVVLSDGRSTVPAKLEEIALRARGRGIPIHALLLGGDWGSRDLAVSAAPRQVTAFKGQPIKVAALIANHGLGAIQPSVMLLGPDGKELARKVVSLAEGGRETVHFEIPEASGVSGDYTLGTEPWPGEHLRSNNSDIVRVSVVTTKTRVLLLEGAPYWDSKFLARLLRQQSAMEILTVHRLNEERYFRVEAAGAEPIQSPESVFPSSAKELARYDLIVFGKGAEGFLTPDRVVALQGFVRDQGGSVLFARGKSYAGRFPGLESLEPVEWGDSDSGGFRFTPLPDAGANLFGAALPTAEDRVWSALPLLEDVHSVVRLKPFARVLAEGVLDGRATRTPLLIVRRFGRGMVAALNADGLWRWDFRPEMREQGPVYQQFWVQLMQWCATYSEFRPGQDYAVRLREPQAAPGQPVRAVIAYRGKSSPEAQPFLRITRNGEPFGEAAAIPVSGESGGQEWAAIITPDQPGRYEIRVADKNRAGVLQGHATLTAPTPGAETDDLRPDPESLKMLTQNSGGELFTPGATEKLAAALWAQTPAAAPQSKPKWESAWPQWWVALLITGLFGGEWWLRRRDGLL